ANDANVKSAVEKVSGWLAKMIEAAGEAAKVGTGDNGKIGESTAAAGAANNNKADGESVKGIAKGIKGIVDAAGDAGEKGDALKGVADGGNGAGDGNKDAGKLFATAAAAADDDVKKAAAAVSAVSGKQILKAIVDAAKDEGGQNGATAGAAKNPIAAAIGTANDNANQGFNQGDMQKNDKIAAAIVLRGLAKGGKFAATGANDENVKSTVEKVSGWLAKMIEAAGEAAKVGTGSGKIGESTAAAGAADSNKADGGSVKGIAKGIKGIVEAAGEAAGEKGNALKDVADGGNGADNKNAGKLFATTGGAGGVAAVADDVKKAAAAVSAVSGKQILKAIVDAAGEQNGVAAEAAKNPIAAAIGTANDNANDGFDQGDMQKNDKIAAAIVLRGLAKDGKFAAGANDDANVKSAVEKVSGWLAKMIEAAGEAAKVGTGSGKIGESTTAAEAADSNKADGGSVKGIAKGIKGIVEAAGEAAGEKGNALKDVADGGGNGADNKNAGKLFATTGGAGAVVADDVKKAAAAVSAVSGKQILKAIVDAAGEQNGVAAEEAKNPIAAAIGTNGDNADQGFDDGAMKKNDKIAAAIVLRGLAKDGKFAATGANDENVKSAVEKVSGWLAKMIEAAGEAAKVGTGSGKIGESTATAGADNSNKADGESVKGIAKGIKGIVEAAGAAAAAGAADAANVKSAVEKVSG
ncbi:variable large family protein, partial (plasmid) [Borreliella lanei]|uniref:variable large family protein n=1 Tax=Borreliella lanei TaxID=373540 RepID=UPI003AF14AA2